MNQSALYVIHDSDNLELQIQVLTMLQINKQKWNCEITNELFDSMNICYMHDMNLLLLLIYYCYSH